MKNIKEGSFNLVANELTPSQITMLLRKVFAKGGHPMPICLCGRPGCVAGDMKIRGYWLGNAKKNTNNMTIAHIYQHQHDIKYKGAYQHKSKVFIVRSYNEETKRIEDTAVTSTYSGQKQCYLIKAGKFSVEVTEEHPVFTQRGWIKCCELVPGDVVFTYPDRLTGTPRTKASKMHDVLVKYHPTGSRKVVNGCLYFRKSKHILEYEAFRNNMTFDEYRKILNNYKGQPFYFVPKGLEVHHIDRDRSNNNPDNILLLTTSEHAKLHHKEDGKFGHMGDYLPIPQKIDSITPTSIKDTYDLSCEKNHNFFAGNILVHNCGKSQTIQQVCREFGVSYENGNYHEIRASMVVDSSDLTGLPVVTKKMKMTGVGSEEYEPATVYSKPQQLPLIVLLFPTRNEINYMLFSLMKLTVPLTQAL